MSREALTVRVTGVVQGVGFRPFVHRIALRHALDGWVRNRADGVEIAIEGDQHELEAFVHDLRSDAPPLARIDELQTDHRVPAGLPGFRIAPSADAADKRQPVAPDVAMCGACERELYDWTNRRYRYPFITCTDCGPRYSVIERMPYDRERTTMRAFVQCAECLGEYHRPGDRRHHSETNSCPACGPRTRLIAPGASDSWDEAAIREAARLLRNGAIVAVRGLGGFHIAVDATNDHAVMRLRGAKHRDAKPFAVMVRNLYEARSIADLNPAEAALVCARERPIVIALRAVNAGIAPSVAPGMTTVGVMLAYTPLHHLLLDLVGRPMVMTSGNRSDEPICAGNDEAQARLAGIADAFLVHDREIVARVDDSVMRVARCGPVLLRRARGIAPLPIHLPVATPTPVLAVGAHLKNTIALAQDDAAYISPHIGELDSLETLTHFRETVRRIADLHRIEPRVIAHDLHPGYLSTAEAMRMECERRVGVQHHHAHIAAVCAEHGVTDRVVGVAYDGTGFGEDGTIWGAEILVANLVGYERVGHLRPAPLPGAELAVRSPWRSALGYLALEPLGDVAFARAFEGIAERELEVARRMATQSGLAPMASSMGRLFDAAAAILGVRQRVQFEGQAAMELEALAGREAADPLPMPLHESATGVLSLDPMPLLSALGEGLARGRSLGSLAAVFHESVAAATAATVRRVTEAQGINVVALGGGTFQNARLLGSLVARLRADRLRVLVPQVLPPNDGAISYGQAAVAAARLARERN